MKVRESNYELLRIISMFFIVLWHVIMHGEVNLKTSGSVSFFMNCVLLLSIFHVSVFMLITGYYQSKSTFKLKKLLSLIFEIAFYNFVINTFLYLTGLVEYSNVEYLKSILFYNFSSLWYIQCYIIVYMLSPFLNKFISSADRVTLKRLIIVLLLCFSIFPFFSDSLMYDTNGYTVTHYILLYFIGAYVRKYNLNNEFMKNLNKHQKQLIYFNIFLFSFIANVMLYYFAQYLVGLDSNILNSIGSNLINHKYYYSNPLVIIQSVSLFMLFGTFKFTNKFVNYIASLVLGVYIIHETEAVKNSIYIWTGIYDGNDIFGKAIILKVLIVAIIIFVACLLIEIVRRLIFKLVYKIKVVRYIDGKVVNFIDNLMKIN
ncbi:MAG TPA: acyltransferase [Candidatus Onthousia excrementipullorum]|uniref:Acyltransferase n=1 Tax=Candidatus Onthousia excrementipullorum TaxID=2840884 RepID=A0A9D1J3A1_9FIRM|nr:acyltransferase [Candidatus Onthousia excrementipullorum]